jgi:malate synthase
MSTTMQGLPAGVTLSAPIRPEFSRVLTEAALEFAVELERTFGARRKQLLQRRADRQEEIDAGRLPDFLPDTVDIRQGDWQIAAVPDDLQNRRVEITGPAGDRKMVINALNSGARVYMADFEDANSPTWENTVGGQLNLMDAVRRTIRYESPEGKVYQLRDQVATLIVRPRGWHLEEKHVLVDGTPMSASLFDFALYAFHNANLLLRQGPGRTSTCRNSRAISRRACGTTCSRTRNADSVSRLAASRRRC